MSTNGGAEKVDTTNNAGYDVVVVGIGAMGGGMGRALMDAGVIVGSVTGYDRSTSLANAFYEDSVKLDKRRSAGLKHAPKTLKEAILCGGDDKSTGSRPDFVLLVLQNERQCEEVCFGGDKDENLMSLLSTSDKNDKNNNNDKPCCIILSSTVTAQWAKGAAIKFESAAGANILFVDCPVSGGPARARSGDLTLMASGSDKALHFADPVLQALSNGTGGGNGNSEDDTKNTNLHVIPGGAGMGSTIKMVHQLLAGVHIAAAAEALALAAKAGLRVNQLYDIVNNAAGGSWMFKDRGPRMMMMNGGGGNGNATNGKIPVKSSLDIFVKDLDIVHAESKRLECPVPIASAALQQFIAGRSMGLGRQDDSQVVQVYERITGVQVCGDSGDTTITTNSKITNGNKTTKAEQEEEPPPAKKQKVQKKEGNGVGDLWTLDDGRVLEIVEVGSEPRHKVVLSNDYVRAMRVRIEAKDTTIAHLHAEDSLYFFLAPNGNEFINHVKGSDPACDCVQYGEIRYGTHKTDKPLIHTITNTSKNNEPTLCVDAEVLKKPPVTSAIPLVAEKHELVKTRDKCRVYKLTLKPGETVSVSYPFFHLTVVLSPTAVVQTKVGEKLQWTETVVCAAVRWNEPVMDLQKTNKGDTVFEEYIAEWR